jgi:ABC-type phosphate transport system substrate-binding protein
MACLGGRERAGRHASLLMPFILLVPLTCRAELLVIAHPGNPIDQFTREQVVDLYMGRLSNFPDGRPALPIDQAAESPARAQFYQTLIGKSVPQVNAYWARLLFTGRATPPRVLGQVNAILRTVRENPDALAYVDSKDYDGRAKVLYRMKP